MKPAVWHWFAVNGEEERSLFAFPGVWTRYCGPLKKNGDNVDQEVFAFMTTEPNELTASINHERMPVLISDPRQDPEGRARAKLTKIAESQLNAEAVEFNSAPAEQMLRVLTFYRLRDTSGQSLAVSEP